MKYLPLFSVEILHDYYADRRCSDFEIEATPETQKLLGNCRCVLKPLPNGFRVLTLGAGPDAPFIPLPVDATFAFHLRLQNPNFILFTDFSEIGMAAAPVYMNSAASNLELKLVSRETSAAESFVVRQPAKKEAFVLGGRPLNGTAPASFRVDGLGAASKPVAYDEAAKVVSVNSEASKAGTAFTITYPTAPQLQRGVFADIEIKYATTMAGGANNFQIVFKAKKVRWKYYVVTNKTDTKANVPAIEDKDKAIVFAAAGRTDLTQSPDLADKIATELVEQYPNMQTFRFVSDALIPCQEAARKSIQFQVNGDKVVDALPNPALQNYVIDVKDSKKEDSLYHVVKYFTH
jgi:hypothetical protein